MYRVVLASILAVLVFLSGAPAGYARSRADNPDSHRQAVLELFDLLEMKSLMENAVSISLDAQIRANPALAPYRDVVRSFFDTYIGYDSVRDDLATLYMERFTEKELRQIVAFYSTPVGRKTVSSMPDLMARGAQLGQDRLKAHLGELQDLIARRMKELDQQGGTAAPEDGAAPPTNDPADDDAPAGPPPRKK